MSICAFEHYVWRVAEWGHYYLLSDYTSEWRSEVIE